MVSEFVVQRKATAVDILVDIIFGFDLAPHCVVLIFEPLTRGPPPQQGRGGDRDRHSKQKTHSAIQLLNKTKPRKLGSEALRGVA